MSKNKTRSNLRLKLHEIIFKADTPAGKGFDVLLLFLILLSVFAVMLESVSLIELVYGNLLRQIEWLFTILFTFEYALRIFCVGSPKKYIFCFFGVVDLLTILPIYLTLFIPGIVGFTIIRSLRLLRFFRVFKLAQFTNEGRSLPIALKKV